MLEQLRARANLLAQALEQSLTAHNGLVARADQAKDQSLANHNALVGRKLEIDEMVKHYEEEEAKKIADAVEPGEVIESVDHEES
jgi:precorrin-6x reductase